MIRICPFENRSHKEFSIDSLQQPNKPWRDSIFKHSTSLSGLMDSSKINIQLFPVWYYKHAICRVYTFRYEQKCGELWFWNHCRDESLVIHCNVFFYAHN